MQTIQTIFEFGRKALQKDEDEIKVLIYDIEVNLLSEGWKSDSIHWLVTKKRLTQEALSK